MNLKKVLNKNVAELELQGSSKQEIIENLLDILVKSGKVKDRDVALEALLEREVKMSTGIQQGIAIPHCRMAGCTSPVSAVLRLDAPVDFDAIDGEPVDLLFVLLVPEAATDEHLELLRQIAVTIRRNDRARLGRPKRFRKHQGRRTGETRIRGLCAG